MPVIDRKTFMKMTKEQRLALAPVEKCAACGVVLQQSITGREKSPKGIVCEDCGLSQLSEEIEKNPIGVLGRRKSG